MKDEPRAHPFRDSTQDIEAAHRIPDTPQTRAPAYRLAFADPDFMTREELRPVRLQLELLKPQLVMDERGIESTIVLFGGARIPAPEHKDSAKTPMLAELTRYYDEARRFSRLMTERSMESYGKQNVIVTGGGPGIMEAANRGAREAGAPSIGYNITLPHEQEPNDSQSPEFAFNFHYFAMRKMHFLMRAAAVCIFPGGFGTLDEMFESLTLIQTKRMKPIPFLLFGRGWWETVINWGHLAEAGVISPEDLKLFQFVETAEEAMAAIDAFETPCP